MIAIRKETSAFADFNNREFMDLGNDSLFAFSRFDPLRPSEKVLVVANFNDRPQYFDLESPGQTAFRPHDGLHDLYSGRRPSQFDRRLVLQSYQFYWLTRI
jgi:amylosucrase